MAEADDPTTAPRRLHLGSQVISGSSLVRDANGVAVTYKAPLEGWDSPSGIKGATTQFAFGPGAWAEDFEFTERTLGIEGNIIVEDTGDLVEDDRRKLRDRIEEIIAEIPLNKDIPLVLWEFGEARHMMVRFGGEQDFDRIGEVKNSGLVAPYSMQLVALDALKLDGDGSDYTVQLEKAGAGGSLTYQNAGRGGFPPTILRLSDVTNPVLTCNGVSSTFSNLIVPAGQWLELNFKSGSVTLNGVNVRDKMSARWLPLEAAGYTVTYSTTAAGSTGRMQLKTFNSFA